MSDVITKLRVFCINKTDRYSAHDRIKSIGGMHSDARRWKITQTQAIEFIERGTKFYVSVGGETVDVIVATSPYGNKYIKTRNDGEQPNNLLSLPECP